MPKVEIFKKKLADNYKQIFSFSTIISPKIPNNYRYFILFDVTNYTVNVKNGFVCVNMILCYLSSANFVWMCDELGGEI